MSSDPAPTQGARERAAIETFEDLRVRNAPCCVNSDFKSELRTVWQQGIELVKQIYSITREGEISRDFGLRDQLRRAAVSIPTNVAEGFERYSRKEYVNFLSLGAHSLASYADAGSHRNIAKGSAGERRIVRRI